MLRIIREKESKLFRYSILTGTKFDIEAYETYISSGMSNVEVSLRIKDKDSESVVSIPGGKGLVEISNSTVSIYTEEPVTVQSNGSDSKEEPPKK